MGRPDKNKSTTTIPTWNKVCKKSEFEDKEEFLDIIYWGNLE